MTNIEKCYQLLDEEKHEDALDCLDKLIIKNPNDKEALYLKGTVYFELNELDSAIEYFNKVLKIDPEFLDAINDKGAVLLGLNKIEEAKKCFNKTINLDPNYVNGWHNMGITLYFSDDFAESLKFFDKAIKLDNKNINAIHFKGLGLRELKKSNEALKCFEEIIKINPEDVEAWYQKGNLLRDIKEEKEALESYKKFVELVDNNDISEWKLTASRVKEYIRMSKDGEEISISPLEKPQFWQWVTKSEYFLESNGEERKDLDPKLDSDPGGFWTCHKDTRIGDLILLYRAGKKNGITYQDIKYLIQAQSDAYTIDYDEYAFEHGWQYGCDYKPLFKFENSINYHELKNDPYLEDWNALRGRFQGIVFKTEERHWKRLQELLSLRNPEYKEFLKTFKPKEVVETAISEKLVEDKLSENLNVLKKFGYDLKLLGRQVRCIGQGGRIDLLCEDNNDDSLVIIELKIVKATRNTFGQISNYIGWAIKRKADGRNVKGIVISKGYDNEFDSAQLTNKDTNFIDLANVLDELGMKIKY